MRLLRGCFIGCLILIAIVVVAIVVLALTATPLSLWLYAHNYYFQDLVNALHGPAAAHQR